MSEGFGFARGSGSFRAVEQLTGNTNGLSPAQKKMLERSCVHELQRSGGLDCLELITSLEEEWAAAVGPVRAVQDGRDRAVLVHVEHPRAPDSEARIAELKELCRTAGVRVQDVVTQRRPQLDPRWLIGKGKLEELVMRALQADAQMLVFDHDLSPAQARTISDATELNVVDRTMLILDIFAQHALSRDGKLQV